MAAAAELVVKVIRATFTLSMRGDGYISRPKQLSGLDVYLRHTGCKALPAFIVPKMVGVRLEARQGLALGPLYPDIYYLYVGPCARAEDGDKTVLPGNRRSRRHVAAVSMQTSRQGTSCTASALPGLDRMGCGPALERPGICRVNLTSIRGFATQASSSCEA